MVSGLDSAQMRPDRSVVKKALIDARGDKTKAAALLGCSRQSLYTWIYQHGLERLAGISLDRRPGLDTDVRQDTKGRKELNRVSNQVSGTAPILRAVPMVNEIEIPLQATVKLPESLWKRVKIEAIRRGCTVSDLVRETLEAAIEDDRGASRKKAGKGGDEGGR